MRLLENELPWKRLVNMPNALAASGDRLKTISVVHPLPEDSPLRGHDFPKWYLPDGMTVRNGHWNSGSWTQSALSASVAGYSHSCNEDHPLLE